MIVACTWPEEVLRVPRKCADAAALKAAYRRVSIAVHPDKCSAGESMFGYRRACCCMCSGKLDPAPAHSIAGWLPARTLLRSLGHV